MYADTITNSMDKAISETKRRRKIQMAYNEKNGITPTTIHKDIREVIESTMVLEEKQEYNSLKEAVEADNEKIDELIKTHEKQMRTAAKELRFEEAAKLRDIITKLKKQKNKKLV
jgi:excinuclease ABC subunit B